MTRFLLTSVGLVLLSSSTFAAEITIGPGVCDKLINYVEPPGVEYQPGIDATGHPVSPAELGNPPAMKLPKRLVIPITDDLAARLGEGGAGTATVQTPVGVANPQLLLGTVTLEGNRLLFNGQPIGEDVDGPLGDACREAMQAH